MGEKREFGGRCKHGHPWVPANVKVYLDPEGHEMRVCRTCERERGRRRLQDPVRRAEARRLNAAWRKVMKSTRPEGWSARQQRVRDLVSSYQYYRGKDRVARQAALVVVRLRRWLREQQATEQAATGAALPLMPVGDDNRAGRNRIAAGTCIGDASTTSLLAEAEVAIGRLSRQTHVSRDARCDRRTDKTVRFERRKAERARGGFPGQRRRAPEGRRRRRAN